MRLSHAGRRWGLALAGLLLVALAFYLAGCRPWDRRPTPDSSQTSGATQTASSTVPVTHGPVELVMQPDAGSARLVQAIDGAEQSLRMKVYLVTEDDVVDALKRAAQRGVDTRVMIEPNPEGGGDTNRVAAQELAAAGVQVLDTPSAFRLSHEKSLVVDDRVAFIMTHNLTRSSFAKNREFEAISEEEAVVEEVAQVFDADWDRREPDLSQAQLVWSPINSRSRITALIDGARATLDLYQASVLDDELNERLNAAVKRGVQVRLVMSPPNDPSDPDLSEMNVLQAGGVQLRVLEEPYIHAKTLLADGKTAFVGSENFTKSSLELNRELGIVFDDAAAVNRLAGAFLEDWNQATPWSVPEDTPSSSSSPSSPPPPPGSVVPWQDAGSHAGQTITVEGEIVDSYNSGKVAFLNFSRNRDDFKLVVFAEAFGRFPQPPEQLYLGKQVRATGEVKLYQGKPEMDIGDPSQIEIVGDRALLPVVPTATVPAAGIVPWQDAGQYIGQRVTVEGDVVRSYNSGKVAFLNFAQDYKGTFSVVVFASDYSKWPQTPDQFYLGQKIRASGKVKEYQGAPEMIVETPEQIEVVGLSETVAGAPLKSPEITPRAAAAPAPKASEVVSWEEAALYEGQQVTVEGTVVDTYKSAKVIFLNFSPNREAFKLVIFAGDWKLWPELPDVLYRGKTLHVTGEVELYKGAPEIIVNRPEQVVVQ